MTLYRTAAACALLSACASHPTTSIYHGRYEYNFEYAIFIPDGTDERWCTVGNMLKAEVPLTYGSAELGRADVVVRGKVSAKGRFGNLGSCIRQIEVDDVLEAHPYSPR